MPDTSAVSFLGLNSPQLTDTKIDKYSNEDLGKLLEQFHKDLRKDSQVTQIFNGKYSEGYEIIVNTLNAYKIENGAHLKLQKQCFNILGQLFMDSNGTESIKNFFNTRGACNFIIRYMQRVIKRNYKDFSQSWFKLMDIIKVMQEKDFQYTFEIIFNQCKFVRIVAPILLDSDNLNVQDEDGGLQASDEKLKIVKSTFLLLDHITNTDDGTHETKKTVKTILE